MELPKPVDSRARIDVSAFRSFRLDRVDEMEVLDDSFHPEPGKTLQDFLKRDTE